MSASNIPTLTALPPNTIVNIGYHLRSSVDCGRFTMVCRQFRDCKPLIENRFKTEIDRIVTICSIQNLQVNGQDITKIISGLKLGTIKWVKEQIKIPLLRALLQSTYPEDKRDSLLKTSSHLFPTIFEVFQMVQAVKDYLAKVGFGSLDILALQNISRALINNERCAEAIEVVRCGSTDKKAAELYLVEDLAQAQAISWAESVANEMTDPKYKSLALEKIEESIEDRIAFEYNTGIKFQYKDLD